METLVSVVSVFYNRAAYVEQSVQSLINQSFEHFEIILVDDGSTDTTLGELRAISDARITVVSHANMGFVAAVKHAVEVSCGKYIAIHGSGDYSFRRRITEQVEFLERNPEVGAVGCGREIKYENNEATTLVQKDSYFRPGELISFGRNIFSHGEVMMRRDAYELAGGYRTQFKYAQDYDLWLRINETHALCTISKLLYREFSRAEGIRNDPSKLVEQRKYATAARMSAEYRARGKCDPLKEELTPFELIMGSRRAAKELNKFGLKKLRESDTSDHAVIFFTEAVFLYGAIDSRILAKLASYRVVTSAFPLLTRAYRRIRKTAST